MRRGTNPIIKYNINVDTTLIEEVFISFKQDDVKIEKEVSQCSLDTGFIKTQLTQEETLSFNCKKPVLTQARMKLTDGTVCATEIYELKVYDVLKDGVI